MKNILSGLTLTFILALAIFAATQFKQLSSFLVYSISPPTPTALPTKVLPPTPTPEKLLPVTKKQALYLYPKSYIPISVKLNVGNALIGATPSYPQDSWYVTATSNSLIDNQYTHFLIETKLDSYQLKDEGWVVASKDLRTWFNTNLPKFGLNQKEVIDFKNFWLKELNKTGYYEIRLFSDEFLKKNIDYSVTPTPDTLIRVEFYFKYLDQAITLPEASIVTPKRSGFTVLEWGGTI